MPAPVRKPAKSPGKRARKAKPSARPKADKAPPGRMTRAVAEISRGLLKAYRLVVVSPESVLAEAQSRGLHAATLEELRALPVEKREALATMFVKSAKIWATGHGTSLGAIGVVTMAADIAALVAVNLRMVQHIALSYGVPPGPERIDAWALMLGALGEQIDVDATRQITRKQAAPMATKLVTETARLFARRLLRTQGAGRAMPIVGAVFGGLSNYAFTTEVAARAREYYRSLAP